jgi:DNA-directed RNA polymerase beta' subunit
MRTLKEVMQGHSIL